MPLGTEVDLGPGHIEMGTQRPALLPPERGTTAASFVLISIVTVAKRSPVSTTAELLFVSGAIKATILLAHAVFASVNSSDIKNSADVVNIVRNATTTSFRTDNDGHYKSRPVTEMGDCVVSMDMGLKVGVCCTPFCSGS